MLGLSMDIDIEKHDAVKRALRAKGIKLVDIAAKLGCPPSLVTMVSQGRRRSESIERAIAEQLDRQARDIWPDRYNPHQMRRSKMTA